MLQLHPRCWIRTLLTLVTLAGLLVGVAAACNVPVFRYALEHWRPDPYRLAIVHRGPLSDAQQTELKQLADQAERINIAVRTVDVSAPVDAGDEVVVQAVGADAVPQMLLQYPAALKLHQPLIRAPFAGAVSPDWFDSPTRRELVHRLAEGQTAVWVLLTTGDAALDGPAEQLLDEELPLLTRKLKLPELTESPEDVLLGSAPLKISFSRLSLRRDDPAEQALVAMLLGCEADLATTQEPMAFPVFGRCRVLLPLIGAGISADNLHSSAAFLTGACSCQVKNQNPGFDLLHTADWARELVLDHDPAVAFSEATSKAPELVPIPVGSSSPEPTAPIATTVAPPAPPVALPTTFSFTTLALLVVVIAAIAVAIAWRA